VMMLGDPEEIVHAAMAELDRYLVSLKGDQLPEGWCPSCGAKVFRSGIEKHARQCRDLRVDVQN